MRVVPRENEAINETWIADRDRFGFEGMYSAERVTQPMVRVDGVLEPVDWEAALDGRRRGAAEGCRRATAPRATGFLGVAHRRRWRSCTCWRGSRAASAAATSIIVCGSSISAARTAEARHAGARHRDRRRSRSSRASSSIGSNLRHEMPLLAHRIRKAAVKRGAKVALPESARVRIPVSGRRRRHRRRIWSPALAARGARRCRGGGGKPVPAGRAGRSRWAGRIAPWRALLAAGSRRAVILGTLAQRHPAYARLKRARGACSATLDRRERRACSPRGRMRPAPISRVRCRIARRAVRRRAVRRTCRRAPCSETPAQGLRAVRRHRPGQRSCRGRRRRSRARIAWWRRPRICPTRCARWRTWCCPIGTFAESSGTFVNLEGRWQSWTGGGEAGGREPPGLEGAAGARRIC